MIEEEKKDDNNNNSNNNVNNNNNENITESNNPKKVKSGTAACIIPCDTFDDFDNIITNIDSDHEDNHLYYANNIDTNIYNKSITNEKVLAAGTNLTKYDIVLDSASSCNIFTNKYLLKVQMIPNGKIYLFRRKLIFTFIILTVATI